MEDIRCCHVYDLTSCVLSSQYVFRLAFDTFQCCYARILLLPSFSQDMLHFFTPYAVGSCRLTGQFLEYMKR